MTSDQSNADKVRRNMSMVFYIFIFVAIIFVSFGFASGNMSVVSGGVVVLLFGLFTFLLPKFLKKK